jgi:hypothetical protein
MVGADYITAGIIKRKLPLDAVENTGEGAEHIYPPTSGFDNTIIIFIGQEIPEKRKKNHIGSHKNQSTPYLPREKEYV